MKVNGPKISYDYRGFFCRVGSYSDDGSRIEQSLNHKGGGVRTSSARAAILLLAAVYEEYVRQMAGEHALCVADSPRSKGLKRKAWKTTFDELARFNPFVGSNELTESVKSESVEKIESLFAFMSGSFHSELLPNAIRNERNMRPTQLNQIFKLSGIEDISREICDRHCLIQYLNADNPDIAHGLFLERQKRFFDQRNEIAHSPVPQRSVAVDVVEGHVALLGMTSRALTETLGRHQ